MVRVTSLLVTSLLSGLEWQIRTWRICHTTDNAQSVHRSGYIKYSKHVTTHLLRPSVPKLTAHPSSKFVRCCGLSVPGKRPNKFAVTIGRFDVKYNRTETSKQQLQSSFRLLNSVLTRMWKNIQFCELFRPDVVSNVLIALDRHTHSYQLRTTDLL